MKTARKIGKVTGINLVDETRELAQHRVNENYIFTVYSRPNQTQARAFDVGRQARLYPVNDPSLDTISSDIKELCRSIVGSSA